MSRLLLLIPLLLLAACSGDPQVTALLDRVDSLTYEQPDSALRLLQQHEAEAATWSRSLQMRHALLTARAQNKAFVDFTTDSVLLEVTDYYDCHGTPNQQLEAHYLLGCAYRDLGEAPRAIDAYQDAIDRSDTTDTDCDYRTLGCIYSQMSDQYHRQLLFSYEIKARKRSQYYGFISGDTLGSISELKFIAGVYLILEEKDSAEIVIKNALNQFYRFGFIQEGLQASTILMSLLAKQPERHSELKTLIDVFEANSASFDENHQLPPSKRLFFFYKGKYFENVHQLDSAEYYYRKVYHKNMPYVAQDPMYRGLLSVYEKRHQPDSIAKYAQLYCAANDSSVFVKDQELTARLAASYNYSHYQKEALDNAAKANKRLVGAIIFLVVAIVSIVAATIFRIQYKKKQLSLEKLRSEHTSITEQYERKLQQLEQLEHTHQQTVATIQQELGRAQSERSEAQSIIERLNVQYDSDKQLLTEEINTYINKVEELERLIIRSNYRRKMIPFMQLGVVKRIKLYAQESRKLLTESDLKLLEEAANDYFPDLLCDLNTASGISKLGTQVCLLVIIELQPNEITHLLNISSVQVANIKKDINIALFDEQTARTLYKNLSARYMFNTA